MIILPNILKCKLVIGEKEPLQTSTTGICSFDKSKFVYIKISK